MMESTHCYRGYVFSIAYHPQEPAFTVNFADVPEIITSGGDLPEAFSNACEALDLHLESPAGRRVSWLTQDAEIACPAGGFRGIVEGVGLAIRERGHWGSIVLAAVIGAGNRGLMGLAG